MKFGEMIAGDLEVKCRNPRCGAGPGIVVLHRFDVESGKFLGTTRYRAIENRKEK